MAQDIDTAQDYVNVMFYIIGTDPKNRPGYADVVLDAMARAVQRGVTVRLILTTSVQRGCPVIVTCCPGWMLPVSNIIARYRCARGGGNISVRTCEIIAKWLSLTASWGTPAR